MSDRLNDPVELFPVVPIFCSALHAVEIINGMAHVSFYTDQPCDGRAQKVLSLRLILPPAALAGMATRILEAPADKVSATAAWAYDAVGGRA